MGFCIALCQFAIITPAQYGLSDFIISGCDSDNVAVYSSTLVFQNNLATGWTGCPSGLELLFNGNVVAINRDAGVRRYNFAGTLVGSFSDPNTGSPYEIKAHGSNLFVGTGSLGVSKYNLDGTGFTNIGGTAGYIGVAILPGGILWAAGNTGQIDVYNANTGAFLNSIPFDNGQVNAQGMFYSGATNTVLISDFISQSVFERQTNGTFVQAFTGAGGNIWGVTRGPGGNVFASDCFNSRIVQWTATGTLVGTTDVSAQVVCPIGIIWTGNLVPLAANVTISGRVFNSSGYPVMGAIVQVMDAEGNTRTGRTSTFGFFRIGDIEAGQSYVISVNAKRYTFEPQTVTVTDDISDLTFTAQEPKALVAPGKKSASPKTH